MSALRDWDIQPLSDIDLLSNPSFASQDTLAGPLRYDVQNTTQCEFRNSLLAMLQMILGKHPRPAIQRTLCEILDDSLSQAVVYCNAYRLNDETRLHRSSTLLDECLHE